MRLFCRFSMDQLIELPGASMREKVDVLEQSVLHLPPVECRITNHFAPGVYAREVFLPADTLAIGAVHKTDNLIILSQGTVRYATEEGSVEISAPHTLLCKAGTKNAVHAITDAVWTNIHPTTETDLDKLAETLTESKLSELQGGTDNKQLAAYTAAQLEI